MNRRRVLKLATAAVAQLTLCGHTPYGQWVVYRKKHLLIGCHKVDPTTYDLAKRVVAVLGEHLPAANSRVARAPDAQRLASLLGTAQFDVAILNLADAVAMLHGADGFAAYGAVALRLLTPVGDRLLLSRAEFPERHARLLVEALSGSELVPARDQLHDVDVPWHPGSLAYLRDGPEPSSN